MTSTAPRSPRTAACSSGPSTSPIQRSRVEHLGGVGAVAQHLAEPLVERAVRAARRSRGSSRTHIHMRRRDDAGHRADGAAVVARLEADRRAALEERCGVLGVVDEALESGAAHQRAAQRAGGARPLDRRAGVQELALLEAEHLGGGRDVDEVGRDAEHRAPARRLASGRQRVGGDRREVGLGARHRRAPVDAVDVDGLVRDGVGEHVRPDGDDAVGWLIGQLLRSAGWRGGWRSALERCTSAPAATRASDWASRPCGSRSVPTTATTDRAADRRDRRGEQRGRVGLGAVAEDEVEQDDAGVAGRRRPGPAARGAGSGRSSGARGPG